MTKPCNNLVIKSATALAIRDNKQRNMTQQLRIIKDCLLEYREMRVRLIIVPSAAVKHIEPVSRPWVRALGYPYR